MLISSPNPEKTIHGCQLLSKKLNSPLPKEVELKAMLQFIEGVSPKPPLVWLCIAKVLVHMSPGHPVMPQHLPPADTLRILKEMPSAIAQVRVEPSKDSNSLRHAYLQAAIPLFLGHFDSQRELVMQCIDGFISHYTRLNNADMLLKIMA